MMHKTESIIQLTPCLKDYIWGGTWLKEHYGRGCDMNIVSESWELSIHPDGVSKCYCGLLTDYFRNNPFSISANADELPILIKYIDARNNLSVQVHPNDEYARQNCIGKGKTEMWYIVHADIGAGIYCGFNQDIDKETFLRNVESGTIENLLNFIPVRSGDCYLIKAGTVHAICAGCVICEVQQNSNTTYRIYDYGRKDVNGNLRQLHINEALKVINFDRFVDETNSGNYYNVGTSSVRLLTECEYFRCRELLINGEYSENADSSFIAVNIIDGEGTLNNQNFMRGDSFFVPYRERLTLNGKAKILLTDNYHKEI